MRSLGKYFFGILIFLNIFVLVVPQVQAISFSNSNFFKLPKLIKKPKPTAAPRSPYVKIKYPNGGEVFTFGDTVKVSWEKNQINNCWLGFSFGPGSLDWINTEITGDMSSYDWVINNWNMDDEPSKIKIELDCFSDKGSVADQSDDFFTVNPIPTPPPAGGSTPTPVSSSTPKPSEQPPVIIMPYPSYSPGFFGVGVTISSFTRRISGN